MSERSTVSQVVQFGVESTPGTAVAASKRISSLGLTIGPKVDANELLPTGMKYASAQIIGKEWAEAEIEGAPVYPELPYIFASLLSAPTITETMDGSTHTGAFTYVFDTATFAEDAPKTYTIEQGSSTRAHRVTNALMQEWSMEWDRNEIALGGVMLCAAMEDGITMTATPTSYSQIPVRPSQVSLYLDSTGAGLGTTKLTRALKGEFKIEDRFGALWVVDAAETSFVATVETQPKVEFTLMQMADAAAMANLTAMRNGSTQFLRWEAVGPQIYSNGGVVCNHKLTIDMAGQITDVGPFEDQDGVYAVEWTFGGVHDTTWGKAMHVEVVTTTASL